MSAIFSINDMKCKLSDKIMLNPVLTPEGEYYEYYQLIEREIDILKKNNIDILNYENFDFSLVIPCKMMKEIISSYLNLNPEQKINQYYHNNFNNEIFHFLLYKNKNNINSLTEPYQEAINYFCNFTNLTLIIKHHSEHITNFFANINVIEHIVNKNKYERNIIIKYVVPEKGIFTDENYIFGYSFIFQDNSLIKIIQNFSKENLFIENDDGNNLSHYLVQNNNFCTIKYLKEIGIDLNKCNNQGLTPLHIACKKEKNANIIRFLVQNGCDLTKIDNYGNTCLHYLTEFQLYNTIQHYLNNLENYSILYHRNIYGIDIFHILYLKGRINLIENLKVKYQIEQPKKKRRSIIS